MEIRKYHFLIGRESMKCEKCGRPMTLRLIEKGKYFDIEIWGCTNLRCLYMVRIIKNKK